MKKTLLLIFTFLSAGISQGAPLPPVTALAYHPSFPVLAAGMYGEVLLIDPAKADGISRLPGQTQRVTALAFSSQGDRLAVASGRPGKSGEIRLYRVTAQTFSSPLLEATITPHTDVIYALAFSPDGKKLASAGYDRVIRVVDPAKPQVVIQELKDHSDAVYGLDFHPEGKLLASAGADRAVKVWDIATGKRLYTLSEPTDAVHSVVWSPDKLHLAAAGIDKSIRIWQADANGGRLVHSVFAHTEPVTRILYSQNGQVLYSIGEGGSCKSWNAAAMKEKLVFPAQKETILALALSPDQKQLALGLFDGALKLLASDNGKIVAEPLPIKPKPAILRKMTPAQGVRGSQVRVVFTGEHLNEVTEIAASPGIQAEILPEGRGPTQLIARLTIDSQFKPGKTNLLAKSPAGNSAALPFFVDRYPVASGMMANESSRTGSRVTLPATLIGTLSKPGKADYFHFEAKTGQEIAIQVFTGEIGSKLDPFLELTDAQGKVLVDSANGLLGYVAQDSGYLAISIRDKEFRGGGDYSYRLSIGSFPLITGASPLSLQRGSSGLVRIHGVNLGNQRSLPVTIPADAKPGSRIPIALPGLSEAVVGEAAVRAGEFPEVRVAQKEAHIQVPGTATGTLAEPQQVHAISFEAKKGQRLLLEVEARRLGSPLDSVIEIVDSQNQLVMRATLRSTARIFSTFRDSDSVNPGIRLESWHELGMDDYLFVDGELMRVKELPKGPDDDCQFYEVAGRRQGFLETTPTQHYNGSPMYKVEIHPAGSSFPANGLPLIQLPYRNDDGGASYGKDSLLTFDPPQDGTYRVRLKDVRGAGGELFSYRLTVRPPHPDFAVAFNSANPVVWKGGSVPINVTATRIDGFNGPIHFALENLPEGLEAPPSSIDREQLTMTFPLFAKLSAKLPETPALKPLKLVARATIDGREVVREFVGGPPKLADAGDIVATTSVSEVSLKPGQETRLVVKVERRNGYAGRIPIEVRGLPHGVRVENIGLNGILITPGTSEREIVLFAESWVPELEHPLIVLARNESKGTDYGAKPVILKVRK